MAIIKPYSQLPFWFCLIYSRAMNGELIDIVYQGVPGSYSEASLKEFCKQNNINVNPVEERGYFEGLFDSISSKSGLGWVPVSNSHAGTVHQSIDMFLQHDVEILAEYYFNVNHCLAVRPGVSINDITTAHSHIQALSQCSDFLRDHGIATLAYHDTAAAAEMVAHTGSDSDAAICSEWAANMYGLDIVARTIQNDENNVTRFLLVKKRDKHYSFEDNVDITDNDLYKTTVIFAATEESGSLYGCISGFAGAKINMTKLESRRHNADDFDYVFYLDYDQHQDTPASQGALAVLRQHSAMVRVLGSYAKCARP